MPAGAADAGSPSLCLCLPLSLCLQISLSLGPTGPLLSYLHTHSQGKLGRMESAAGAMVTGVGEKGNEVWQKGKPMIS